MRKILLVVFAIMLQIPIYAQAYDTIVIGSEPEAISAAISCRRNGQKVLLIDDKNTLGGLYTSGMLTMLDLNYVATGKKDLVNQGFFREFYKAIGKEGNIDAKQAKEYFYQLCRKEKVDICLGVKKILPIKKENGVTGVSYLKDNYSYIDTANIIIDASRDALFSRRAGVGYKIGREEFGQKNKCAAATLVFSVDGVEWDKVKEYLNNDKLEDTGANNNVAWGYPQMLMYKASSPRFQLRRLNLSLQQDGSVHINALQIFNVNPLEEKEIIFAKEIATKEIPKVIEYLRKHAKGFEDARLKKIASELYIREGVRIIGAYTLTGEDIFSQREFFDKIAYGSYPTDLQAVKKDNKGGEVLNWTQAYSIPARVMLPKEVENLLVVGRSASYDIIAHSSARTVPIGMALGEAAGVISSYAVQNKKTVREVINNPNHIKKVQQILQSQGVVLENPYQDRQREKESWAYPFIVCLRKQGFLSKAFKMKNDYGCKQLATVEKIDNIQMLIHMHAPFPFEIIQTKENDNLVLTMQEMLKRISIWTNIPLQTIEDAYEYGILSQEVYNHLANKKQLLNEDVYACIAEIIAFIQQKNKEWLIN